MSKLWFKFGAMNCGKTTRLMQEAHNYEERGMKVFVIKSAIDLKADDCISSRIGLNRKVDLLIQKDESIIGHLPDELLDKISCIFVDEAQFLSEEQVDELFYIARYKNIPVMCYGLKNDFRTKLFEGSQRLLELTDPDTQEFLKTICSCGTLARFNARKINGEFVNEGEQVAIDGIDAEYESLCPNCYDKLVLKRKR